MLVVLADFATGQPFGHDRAYYDDLVFNAQRQPSVNGRIRSIHEGELLRKQVRPRTLPQTRQPPMG